MERKYKVGEEVNILYNNETVTAKVFAHINLALGKKAAYSLKIGSKFLFVEESEIIEEVNE